MTSKDAKNRGRLNPNSFAEAPDWSAVRVPRKSFTTG
jgi:hypothetical protein